MQKYTDIFEQKVKAGKAKTMTPIFHKWSLKEGEVADRVIGAFIRKDEVLKKGEPQGYFNYVFQTDNGAVTFNLGKHVEERLDSQFVPGNIYAVLYKGKKELGDGKRLNEFDIYDLSKEDDEAPAEEAPAEEIKEDVKGSKKKN